PGPFAARPRRGPTPAGPEVSAINQVDHTNFGAELLRAPPRRPVVVEHEGVAHVTRPATDELEIRVRRHREIHAAPPIRFAHGDAEEVELLRVGECPTGSEHGLRGRLRADPERADGASGPI